MGCLVASGLPNTFILQAPGKQDRTHNVRSAPTPTTDPLAEYSMIMHADGVFGAALDQHCIVEKKGTTVTTYASRMCKSLALASAAFALSASAASRSAALIWALVGAALGVGW